MTVAQYDRLPGMVQDVFVPDTLIAGDFNLVTTTITIGAGLVLYRGSLVGLVTSTGYYELATSAATDGSQLPANWVILGENVDTSAAGTNAPTNAPAYLTGEFDSAAMTFGTGITAASAAASLRPNSIFLKTTVLNDIIL